MFLKDPLKFQECPNGRSYRDGAAMAVKESVPRYADTFFDCHRRSVPLGTPVWTPLEFQRNLETHVMTPPCFKRQFFPRHAKRAQAIQMDPPDLQGPLRNPRRGPKNERAPAYLDTRAREEESGCPGFLKDAHRPNITHPQGP